MLVDVWHVPIWLSLGVIAVTLALTAIFSLRATSKTSTPA